MTANFTSTKEAPVKALPAPMVLGQKFVFILNLRYAGRYVRTEDLTLDREFLDEGVPFGGEGTVDYFYWDFERQEIRLVVDWGMEWAISMSTKITEIKPEQKEVR